MKIKAEIFQIIKWEQKERYFNYTDFGESPMDLLHLAPIDDKTLKWYERLLSVLAFLVPKHQRKVFKYYNFPFTQEIYDKKGHYQYNGLPLFVPSPSDYKEGDIVEIEYNIKKEDRK